MIADIMRKVINKEDLTDDDRNDLVAWFERAEPAPSLLETMFKGASRITSAAQITDGVMGIMVAGKFIALAPGVLTVLPTDAGFTGTFVSGSGETFGSTVYNIGGVLLGAIQWGANQSTGALIAGGGNVLLDAGGIFLQNSATSWFNFEDAAGNRGTINIAADPNNDLEIVNLATGPDGTISFFLKNDSGATKRVVHMHKWSAFTDGFEFSFERNTAEGARVAFGIDHYIDYLKDDGTGSATVYFNDRNKNIDFNVQGATDSSLVLVDASTDRVGIGVAAPTVKLDVNGTINIATGNTYKINGTDVISATKTGQTTEEIQDIAGAMFTGNTESGVTVTYQDSDGTIDVELTASVNGGWTEVTDTWTYNAANAFTVPTDATTVYQPGMKVRWKQGGSYKYSPVQAVATIKVTIVTNTDYVVDNAAVTDVAYSYAANPYGYPADFNWTPSITNLTTTSGTFEAKFNVQGRRVQGHLSFTFGASSAITGSLTLTLPIGVTTYTKITPIGLCRFKDATGGDANAGTIFSNGIIAVYKSDGTYLTGTGLSSLIPFTWATSDDFEVDFDYFF